MLFVYYSPNQVDILKIERMQLSDELESVEKKWFRWMRNGDQSIFIAFSDPLVWVNGNEKDNITWISASRSLRWSSLLSLTGLSSRSHALLQTNQAPSSISFAFWIRNDLSFLWEFSCCADFWPISLECLLGDAFGDLCTSIFKL